MRHTLYKKIGIAALIMMASVFLSRLTGVFREMAIAAVSGAGASVDAYRVAFVLPEILNHILASGFMSVTFIPIFARYLAREDEEGGWRVFSNILTLFGLLLALLIAVAWIMAPHLVPLLAPGRDDPRFLAMAVRMTRITLPAQLFFFIGGMLMAVQFARKHFLTPALAPIVYNLGIIAGGLVLGSRFGVEGFAWGALAGAIVGNFGVQLIGARKVGLRFRPCWDLRHPDLHRYILLTLPLMLGLTMVFSTEIFSKLFGSYLPDGAIAWIDYAMRVMMILVGFFGQAIGIAAFPEMARLAADGRIAELNRLFNTTLRYLSVVLPVSALILVLRHEIVRLLFERGKFTAADTDMTALALAALMPGAVAFAAQTLVSRGFYAMQNTLLPAIYGTLAVIVSLPLYWLGIKVMGVPGVGMAISASSMIQVWVLFAIWNRRSGNTACAEVYRTYAKTIFMALPLAGMLWYVHHLLQHWIETENLVGTVSVMVATSGVFALLMAIWGWLLQGEEIRHVWRRLASRLKRS